jgi:hypothetical protein
MIERPNTLMNIHPEALGGTIIIVCVSHEEHFVNGVCDYHVQRTGKADGIPTNERVPLASLRGLELMRAVVLCNSYI